MSSAFKKYRMTRKNVLLLAQAIINVNGKITWQDYASDSPYPDQHSLTLNEIKGSLENLSALGMSLRIKCIVMLSMMRCRDWSKNCNSLER